MRKAIALAFAAALILAANPPAFAKSGGDHEGGGAANLPSGFHEGQKTGWSGRSTPPGWHHGEKTGWGKYHRPPGLR